MPVQLSKIDIKRRLHLMIIGDVKGQIYNLIKEKGGVTFVEIEKLPNCKPMEECSMNLPGYPTILLWNGLSEITYKAIADLWNEGKIKATPTHYLTYMADGKCLRLPIARRPYHYKKLHWLPIAFDVVK